MMILSVSFSILSESVYFHNDFKIKVYPVILKHIQEIYQRTWDGEGDGLECV